jgi:divalent metal cation (Fe/Co/Zn/Cd) transporter
MDEDGRTRRDLLKKAFVLEVFTVSWNLLEGLIAVLAGVSARSVALVGFGVDSFIETTSGVVVGWRFLLELRRRVPGGARELERRSSRIAGALLLLLAAYLVVDAARRLGGFGPEAKESLVGLILTLLSLVVMPILGWNKLRTARSLGSKALRADAYETIACSWLSFTTLVGLALNASMGWTWADPLAALVLVPLIVREGLESLRGEEEDE